MKIKYHITLSVLLISITTSCLGDKQAADVSEINNTDFVNTDFKENRINYSKDMSACENMSISDIAVMYNVSEDIIMTEDVSKSNRRAPNSKPICSFFIKDGENDFEWLRGSMSIEREISKDEPNYENAKITGSGEEFEEAWALSKSISKSSEWVKGIGMAAIWNEKNKELKIKFKGYTLLVNPMKNRMNKAEVAKNRDYKKIAIAMAKAAGYIN